MARFSKELANFSLEILNGHTSSRPLQKKFWVPKKNEHSLPPSPASQPGIPAAKAESVYLRLKFSWSVFLTKDKDKANASVNKIPTGVGVPSTPRYVESWELTPARKEECLLNRPWLVLSRQKDESIVIGDDIKITIVDVRGDKVRLGIEAPREVSVHRIEVYEAIQREKAAKGKDEPEHN